MPPRGTLKVAAPTSLDSHLIAPLIAEFTRRYPELQIELLLDDQLVDMVKEGIDVSVSIGWLHDSTIHAAGRIAVSRAAAGTHQFRRSGRLA